MYSVFESLVNLVVSFSMEFERQNLIVTEWETEKAKRKSDRAGERRRRRKARKKNPKIILEQSSNGPEENEDQDENNEEENDQDIESGFEVGLIIEERLNSYF